MKFSPQFQTQFHPLRTITDRTSLSASAIYRLRKCGHWQEGIHYSVLSPKKIVYNAELIMDWITNRAQPQIHERAVQTFLASLPSQTDSKKPAPNKAGQGGVA